MNMLMRTLACAALAISVPTAALAQSAGVPVGKIIRATSEATVTVAPDQAKMLVAVVTQAPAAAAAASENAAKAEAVLAALRAALEPGAEIKTAGYSISPIQVYPREGGEPRITGYTAMNRLAVTTNEIGRVGAAIDAATKAGANSIDGLHFTLKDDTKVQAEALARAARAARARADAIASGLGVTVQEVVHAEEASSPVRPVYMEAAAMRAADASTPIEPGTVEVRAQVTVTVRFL